MMEGVYDGWTVRWVLLWEGVERRKVGASDWNRKVICKDRKLKTDKIVRKEERNRHSRMDSSKANCVKKTRSKSAC